MLVAQSCLILCDPMDSSPPGSSFHGILQPRILDWVAIPFSMGSSRPRGHWVSCIAGRVFTTGPLVCVSVTQSRPALHCPVDCSPSGSSAHGNLQARILAWVSFSSPGDLPDSGIELGSPALQVTSLPSELPGKPHWPTSLQQFLHPVGETLPGASTLEQGALWN